MAVDVTKIRAYQNGLVAVSGFGVTNPVLPTDPTTAINSAVYKEVGALTDEGLTDATSQDSTDIFMWQGNALAASIPGEFVKTFAFAAMETNLTTLGIQYAGSTITQTAYGVSIAEKPPVKDVRTWILHGISDAGKAQRIVVPLGQVSERGDVVWSSTEVTVYGWTIKAFPDANGNVAYRYLLDSSLAA
ncbi:putative phage major tail protein [Actinoplanes missouriensis 431]|uniref:Putative phage major tail protein n=1 Tax=Actinoplanes missouriensis (strain ATCC 14538 / DSM 43046 / CBS 188.64 / JCM 3121 / NBRC 102363 / NCIMB 12654 / NRRL B-3342 / UNCC 431) TaxID=512565 RepID=I0H2R0_ACTM4|nr:hypothetical protein [Actinoplanes missouriensis]BAL87297.1 putative phage major tail protein [Actinoplanes missouriensis 431]